MRSRNDLIEACGYNRRPQDFDDLLGILDAELRLITPTEPVTEEYSISNVESRVSDLQTAEAADLKIQNPPRLESNRAEIRNSFYQLTHDFLVLSIRRWLVRKHTPHAPLGF